MNIGDTIEGRYQIERMLGEGGMGSVYLAHDLSLDKKVAIKTLLPKMLTDLRSVQRLRKEVKISQELRHENICATFDFREIPGQPFMVMEFIDGVTLADFIFRQPNHRCDERAFRALAEQMLAAMEHAHRHGVIHRDLKSGNVMVTQAGSVRVMDFGIAASLKEASSRTTGSPISLSIHYASPEQINGEPAAASMDIYSLGCIFYEMLAGEPPFSQGDILHQQLTKEPGPIPGVPRPLNDAILACLVKDKARRLQTVPEIQAALAGNKTVRISRPVGPVADSKVSGASRPMPIAVGPAAPATLAARNWLPWIWSSVALLAVVAVALLWRQGNERPPASGPPPAQKSVTAPVTSSPPAEVNSPTKSEEQPSPAPVNVAPTAPAPKDPGDDNAQGARRVEALVSQGHQAHEEGAYDRAIAAFRAALKLDPRNEDARAGADKSQKARDAEQGLLGGAAASIDEVANGTRFFDEGRYKEAIDAFQRALAANPGNARAQQGLQRARKAKDAEDRILKKP